MYLYPAITATAAVPYYACQNNLRMIDGAKQEWCLEQHKSTNDIPTWKDLAPYLPIKSHHQNASGALLVCPDGGTYIIGKVGELPKCSIGGYHSLDDKDWANEDKKLDQGWKTKQMIMFWFGIFNLALSGFCFHKWTDEKNRASNNSK
jgi:hypothetical protein